MSKVVCVNLFFFPIWRPELEFDRGGREGREVMYVVGWWGNRREGVEGNANVCRSKEKTIECGERARGEV